MGRTTVDSIAGYVAGTWSIDPVHSEVGFAARHMMVAKVRGKFTTFAGTITTGASVLGSSVNAEVDLTSIDTGNADRDNHIRSADFFDVETNKTMNFTSTSLEPDGDNYKLTGDLSEGPPADRSPRLGGSHVSDGTAAGEVSALVHR